MKNNLNMASNSSSELSEIDIIERMRTPDSESHSTSVILNYCKCKLLLPYVCILGLMGLRPMTVERSLTWSSCSIIGHIQTIFILICLVVGYVVQFAACFRRDRGYCFKENPPDNSLKAQLKDENSLNICNASLVFSYVIPATLHFAGYLYSVYIFRICDNEHLQHLIERVFILSSGPTELSKNPKRILRVLWACIIFGILWTASSAITVNLMTIREEHVWFRWISTWPKICISLLKGLVIFTSLCQDAVQATVIACYCMQAQLLRYQLLFLKERLTQRTIQPLDWMREITEFRMLLRHLNEKVSPAVCLFTVINISWTCSGIMWMLNYDIIEMSTLSNIAVHIINILLWFAIAVAPFVQAARLTTTCVSLKNAGHEIVIRPFLYMETSHEDLHTVLLYTSTLSISAKLFRVPITGRYLCLIGASASIIILILGMCHFLQFNS